MIKKILAASKTAKIISGVLIGTIAVGGIATGTIMLNKKPVEKEDNIIEVVESKWPATFLSEEYNEPKFVDDKKRQNKAFNVADFGSQGSNGWFYRYGKANKPSKSKQIEEFEDDKYYQVGVSGLEVKKDFIQPGEKEAAILEWRAAKKGKINLMVTYVKNVNGDKNPTYPDGVTVTIFKGEELLETHQVDVKVDKEVLMETQIEDMSVEEDESIYIVVDAKNNNAYDGGLLYAAIDNDDSKNAVEEDKTRKNNDADFVADFGKQGANGWYYMCGKDVSTCKLVSSETENGYMNYTSPGLEIGKGFIHPAINDNAIIGWKPKTAGQIEIRGTYTKFEQNDGNPDWPDGVTISIYKNDEKLSEQLVAAPKEGTNKINFREKNINLKSDDRLFFVVSANGNSSYDGGCFDIAILDRNGVKDEKSVTVDESEVRQNFANVKDDFGSQGNNGWIFQEGYQDDPFDTYNVKNYVRILNMWMKVTWKLNEIS